MSSSSNNNNNGLRRQVHQTVPSLNHGHRRRIWPSETTATNVSVTIRDSLSPSRPSPSLTTSSQVRSRSLPPAFVRVSSHFTCAPVVEDFSRKKRRNIWHYTFKYDNTIISQRQGKAQGNLPA
jgi:hypothetical protein